MSHQPQILNTLSLTWVICYFLHYVVITLCAETNFSRTLSERRVYKRISRISFTSCEEECSSSHRCENAIYNRAAKVCSLTQGTTNFIGVEQKGYVLLWGFGDLLKTDSLCGDAICSSLETCVEENNEFICKVTECAILQTDLRFIVYGNIYDIHSRLYVVYPSSNITNRVTCTENGSWIGETFEECCYIGCVSGISVWPIILLIWNTQYNITYYCDMDTDGGHWMVFQRRQDGSENFYRDWNDYVNGFGSVEGEFWLGLDKMYRVLSTGAFELRIDLESFEGERRYAKYRSFSIGPPSDKYRLHVSGYSGDADDSLTHHDRCMFTTYDNDNDKNKHGNCASIYKGGWWYRACHSSNLNGLYFHGGENTTEYATHVHWYHWLGYWYSLKISEMKLRQLP